MVLKTMEKYYTFNQKIANPKVKIIKKTNYFQGYFRIDKYSLSHSGYNGTDIKVDREVFERGHAGCVLPYDKNTDTIIFIEQFRVGAFISGLNPWLLEFPAGIIEKGETSEEMINREAKEEAGLTFSKLIFVQKYLASPGGSTETICLYLGLTDISKISGGGGVISEGEDIRTILIPRKEAFDMCKKGLISNASTIIALQWFELNYEKIVNKL